jgi:hypothetical protein
MHHGQVQKKQWTHLPDERETVGWSTTRTRDRTWMTGTDLLDGDTVTPAVSQRSEVGKGLLCSKEDIGIMTCGIVWYVRLSCRLVCRHRLFSSRRSGHGVMPRQTQISEFKNVISLF